MIKKDFFYLLLLEPCHYFARIDNDFIVFVNFKKYEFALKELECELAYFKDNRDHMDYSSYKKMGLPIGSAVIESVIKQIVNNRPKGTEKHWMR